MSTLKTFLDAKSITTAQLVEASRRLELHDEEARRLMDQRAAKRRDKEQVTKKYAELNLAKPKTLGRGVSSGQVAAALAGTPVSKRVRTKVFRAVNHLLTVKKQPAVDMKALFEGSTAKVGAKPKAASTAA